VILSVLCGKTYVLKRACRFQRCLKDLSVVRLPQPLEWRVMKDEYGLQTNKTIKLICAALAGLYFLWCAWNPREWRLIDGVNLLIHEAGHLFFRPFGEFMMIAGGSLFQVILPAVFVGYFIWQQKRYSSTMVLFWVGESILNVSVYAGDSLALQLPLLGGEDSLHDWNYMLGVMGMLKQTPKIAGMIRFIGTLTILVALVWAIRESLKKPEEETAEAYSQAKVEWWMK